MEISLISISEIKPYGKNAKKHPESQIELIANSIKEFGWQQPIVVDGQNNIIIGHGRFLAAQKLGLKEVPCVKASDLSEQQIKALRLADNRVAESPWDTKLLEIELDEIYDLDMADFGFDFDSTPDIGETGDSGTDDEFIDERDPSCQHNVFENQDLQQFTIENYYGMPIMQPTQTTGDKMLRFMDWKEVDNPEDYIAHFYYDDYKFIAAWREPNKYIDRLRQFKAVVSPDFSLYTDFPRALQILSCYRRQWCGAYWQSLGLDVIPDVVWGDKESYAYCFEGIPSGGTVAVSTVGIKNNREWNGKEGDIFREGYSEMMKRLNPSTIIVYGSMIDGLEGNIISVPSYYEEKAKRGGFNGQRNK